MAKEQYNEAEDIMFDKLKEMSELTVSDFMDNAAAYNGLCSVMCDIYKALTGDTSEK